MASAEAATRERPRRGRASTAHEAWLANSLSPSPALRLSPRARQAFCARAPALPAPLPPPPPGGSSAHAQTRFLASPVGARSEVWPRCARARRGDTAHGLGEAEAGSGRWPHPSEHRLPAPFVTMQPVHRMFVERTLNVPAVVRSELSTLEFLLRVEQRAGTFHTCCPLILTVVL